MSAEKQEKKSEGGKKFGVWNKLNTNLFKGIKPLSLS